MKIPQLLVVLLTIFVFTTTISAQDVATASDNSTSSIENQFDKILDGATQYQDYKVIKKSLVLEFRESLAKYVSEADAKLEKTQNEVAQQRKEIDQLKLELAEVKGNLTTARNQKNTIDFIGFTFEKSSFRMIFWLVTGGLGILLLTFIFLFTRSSSLILHVKKVLRDTEEEFSDYKKYALKKEQKLHRQLQDELNKSM